MSLQSEIRFRFRQGKIKRGSGNGLYRVGEEKGRTRPIARERSEAEQVPVQ